MKHMLTALAGLTLAASASAQTTQWWWDKYTVGSTLNQAVPATGAIPTLLGDPTGANVLLNKSISTQPALVVYGSAGPLGAGLPTTQTTVTADLQLSTSGVAAQAPVYSTLPDTVFAVKNNGTATASASFVYTATPAGATYTPGALACLSVPAGGSCAVAGSPEIATLSIPAGATLTLKLPASVGPTLGTVALTGTLTPGAGVTDPNLANNTSVATTTVIAGSADIALDVTSDVSTVRSGRNVTYNFVMSNTGPSSDDVSLVIYPYTTGNTGGVFQSMTLTATGGGYGDTTSGMYTLPAGSTVTVTLVATPSGAPGSLSLFVVALPVTANITDPNANNNYVFNTVAVTP